MRDPKQEDASALTCVSGAGIKASSVRPDLRRRQTDRRTDTANRFNRFGSVDRYLGRCGVWTESIDRGGPNQAPTKRVIVHSPARTSERTMGRRPAHRYGNGRKKGPPSLDAAQAGRCAINMRYACPAPQPSTYHIPNPFVPSMCCAIQQRTGGHGSQPSDSLDPIRWIAQEEGSLKPRRR